MPARYTHLKCEEEALRYLGVLAAEIAECFEQAFIHIRKGQLKPSPLKPRDRNGQFLGAVNGKTSPILALIVFTL